MNDTILKLEKFGLTSYEAKAFMALMKKHPANGYEISKLARIPPAKIYGTLDRLKNKGIIIANEQVEPIQYYPVPYQKLVHMLKQDYIDTIEELAEDLRQIQPLPNIDLTWNLTNHQAVINKIIEMIENATELIILSIWPSELETIKDYLDAAEKKQVKVIVGIFGESDYHGSNIVNLEKCGVTAQQRLNSRLTVMVVDSKEVVISEMKDLEETVGIWTGIPAIVLVATEYIKHDLWGRMLIDRLGEELFNQLISDNVLLQFLIQNR